MATVLPGTKIEISKIEQGVSRSMSCGMFAAGGITLAQVSGVTGLEPYLIQNWVKRGFLSSPEKRMYSENQFARICIINMLRESLQLEKIIQLFQYINGTLNDESDDIISDAELYHRYVDMLADMNTPHIDSHIIENAAIKASESFNETSPGEKKRLKEVLTVMTYAHFASQARQKAELLLANFDEI